MQNLQEVQFPNNPTLFVNSGGFSMFAVHQRSQSRRSQSKTNSPGQQELKSLRDFCSQENIFFNEGDRINFIKQRSKNHFSHFKKAFDETTTALFKGTSVGVDDNKSECRFRSVVKMMDTSHITRRLKMIQNNQEEDGLELQPMTKTQRVRLDPLDTKDSIVKAQLQKVASVLDSGRIVPLQPKKKPRKRTLRDPLSKLSHTLQKYKH